MSLSLTMMASSKVGDRSWRLAESLTASAILRHWDGVHAGVCQRIRSLTAQIVCARQVAPALAAAPEFAGAGAAAAGDESGIAAVATVACDVAPRPPPSRAAAASDINLGNPGRVPEPSCDGTRRAKLAGFPRKDNFGISASTSNPLCFWRAPSREVGVAGSLLRRGANRVGWQRFDPLRQ